ncbi:hypothetical protein D3C75_751940 [compost metagenome]
MPQIVTDGFRQQEKLLLRRLDLLRHFRIPVLHLPGQQNTHIFSGLLLKGNAPHLLVD